ncbi:MAG: sodium:solute symporter [Opitutaceae bacterium]|jgi:SSS family solute:Na+ symporter|nr:sodium:solute symporter [Opitutaceae bacterium]
MNLAPVDWLIVAAALLALAGIAVWTRRYTRSVSGFLAGNRGAGRYLLTLSEGMTAFGVASLIANFEKFYQAGFAAFWWGMMLAPVGMIVAMSGWVAYRYRETRALTMAQFFEMRYSKNFRVFSGIMCQVSGILNYGVFPGIVANFFIYFCGLPETVAIAGFQCRTLMLVMAVFLGLALALVFFGGMIAVMVTDFFQAQFVNIVFFILMIAIFRRIGWGDTVEALSAAAPGESMLDPFDQQKIGDFNFWFFAIFAFKLFYNCLGWQGSQGYNAAARTPHEAKMARVLAEWRNGVTYLMLMILPIGAWVVMHHAGFAGIQTTVTTTVGAIGEPQIARQMTVPVTLVALLPAGIVGLLAASMAMAAISTDDSCLHSWGAIFVQDVILPFRKNKPPLSPRAHIRLLRLSIVFVAVFAFCWSAWFPLRDYLFMYFLLTGTIYLGGSGAAIVGGFYWRRGATAGAWTAMIAGCAVAVIGISLQAAWPRIPALVALAPKFPVNGAWLAMIAYGTSIVGYVAVSLLACKKTKPFDLERMLHRGRHATATGDGEAVAGSGAPHPDGLPRWKKLLGFTGNFTRGDNIIYFFKLGWTGFWTLVFVLGTVLGLTIGFSKNAWAGFWLFVILLSALVGSATIVWFLWGGFRDLRALFRLLGEKQNDASDDGQIHEERTGEPEI